MAAILSPALMVTVKYKKGNALDKILTQSLNVFLKTS